jgi:hypothetical protein
MRRAGVPLDAGQTPAIRAEQFAFSHGGRCLQPCADELKLEERFHAMQVKQEDTVHTPQIREFEAVMIREKWSLGYYVSFDFSKGALEEMERFQKEQGLTIKPLTVAELLDQ